MEPPPLPPTHFPPTHSPRRSQSSATKQSGWQVQSIITSSFYYCLQGLSNKEDQKLDIPAALAPLSHLQSRFLLALHIRQEVVSLPLQLLGHLAASLLKKKV